VLVACATTEVKSVWKDESKTGKLDKVFVLAIVNQPTSRRAVENGIVNLLNKTHLRAIPTIDTFPDIDKIDKAVASKMIKEYGIDGVLVVRLVNLSAEEVYVSGTSYYDSLYGNRYAGGWYDYYGGGRGILLAPGYNIENYTSTVETAIYSIPTDRILWATVTDTKENAVPKAIDSYLKAIDKSLAASGLF
jgi:hypothetical protein